MLALDACADDPALDYSLGTRAELDAVVADTNGAAESFVADVRDEAATRAAVDHAERVWGGLDAAVAVAGVIGGGRPLWEMPAAQLRTVYDVDLGGVITLARAAIPAMLRQETLRQGRFLAVASAAASRGMPVLSAYSAPKPA